jgi:hypothetical protein
MLIVNFVYFKFWKPEMSDDIGFITLSIIGVVMIFWCYFKWNASSISFTYEDDEHIKKVKKIIVYGLVLIYTMGKYFPNENAQTYDFLYNTVVIVILSVDRILNQLPLDKKDKV